MPPIELIERRTRNSKTHSLGGRKYAWDGTIGSVHYKDNPRDESEQWKDIDTTIVNGRVTKAPYDLDIYLTGMPGFHYKSKESGEFDVRLKAARKGVKLGEIGRIGGTDLPPTIPIPKVEGNRVIWENIYPDTDVILEVQNTRVKLQRLIKSDKAPLDFDVDIQEIKGVAKLLPLKPARDANKQPIKMEEKLVVGGRNEKLKLEVLTELGEIAQPIVYPILDATEVDEQVGDGDDDANNRSACSWIHSGLDFLYIGNVASPDYRNIGLRFQTVNVPQGATCSNCYLTYWAYSGRNYTVPTHVNGEDEDDASNFNGETCSGMNSRARTTASVAWEITGLWLINTWHNSPDISTVIEEIVGRGGWSANNALVILHDDDGTAANSNRYDISAYEEASAEAAKLHIEYTAGGPTEQAVGEGALTPIGNLNLKIFLGVDIGDGAITPTGTLGAILRFLQGTGDGAITPIGTLSLKIAKAVGSGVITPVGTLGLKILLAIGSGVITPVGTLAAKLLLVVGEGAIIPVGTLSRKIFLAVGAGAITPIGTLARKIILAMGAGIITPVGTLGRAIKAFSVGNGIVTPIGVLGLKTLISIGAGAITPVGALGRKILAFNVGQGIITPVGTLGRKVLLAVGSGAITPIGTLATLLIGIFYQAVGGGIITPVGTLTRRISECISVGIKATRLAIVQLPISRLCRRIWRLL